MIKSAKCDAWRIGYHPSRYVGSGMLILRALLNKAKQTSFSAN